jgi:hypothetical protein
MKEKGPKLSSKKKSELGRDVRIQSRSRSRTRQNGTAKSAALAKEATEKKKK